MNAPKDHTQDANDFVPLGNTATSPAPPPTELLVGLDLETTGLGPMARPPREDFVVEVGVAFETPAGLESWAGVCNPGSAAFAGGRAQEAMRINGIADAELEDADSPEWVVAQMTGVLVHVAAGRPIHLVICNAEFDQWYLDRIPAFYAWRLRNRVKVSDAKTRAEDYLTRRGDVEKWRGKSGRLSTRDIVRALGVDAVEADAHRAARDARVAHMIWRKLNALGAA